MKRPTSFFRRYRFDRIDFYRTGNCWHFWELPYRMSFFSGDVVQFCWWRIVVVFEARRNTEPY